MPPVQSARTCRLVGLVPRGSQRAAGLWPWTPGHAPPMGSLRGGGAAPAGAGVLRNHLVARTIFLSLDYQENPAQMPKMLDRDRVGSDGRPGRVPGRAKVVWWDNDARRSPGCRAPDVERCVTSRALAIGTAPFTVASGCWRRSQDPHRDGPHPAGRGWVLGAGKPGTSSSQRRSCSPPSASAACTAEAGSLPCRRSAGCSPSRVESGLTWSRLPNCGQVCTRRLDPAARRAQDVNAGSRRRVRPATR